MNFIKQMMIGLVIGGGMILPGVSGGVLAVVFGIYERMIEAISHFFKNVKKNTLFLAPLVLGLIMGVILFGKILFFVFDKYPMESKFTFIGLIIGGLPVLFKEVKTKGTKKLYNVSFLMTFFIAIALFVLGKDTLNINFSSSIGTGFISFGLLFLTGFIFIAGKVVPGISSSFMLMLIGMYQFLLNILNDPFNLTMREYIQLIPFVLGIIVGAVILMKIIESLIKNHFTGTYSAIIGFVIGSIAAIYPGFEFNNHGLISILLLAVSFFIAYKFTLTEHKEAKDK